MLYLSDDVAEQNSVLAFTKKLHVMLDKLEPLASINPAVEKLLGAMLWPSSVWCREAITGCAECDFLRFAKDTSDDLKTACLGFTVKCIEDLHRNLNVKARQDYNGDISRNMRWHVAKTCGVIEDMDHQQPIPTSEDKFKAGKEKLNHRHYGVCTFDFSMGEEIFKDLLDTKDVFISVLHQVNIHSIPFFVYN